MTLEEFEERERQKREMFNKRQIGGIQERYTASRSPSSSRSPTNPSYQRSYSERRDSYYNDQSWMNERQSNNNMQRLKD